MRHSLPLSAAAITALLCVLCQPSRAAWPHDPSLRRSVHDSPANSQGARFSVATAAAGQSFAVSSPGLAAVTSETLAFSANFDSALPPEFSAPGCNRDPVLGWGGLGPVGGAFAGNFLRYSALTLSDTRLVLRGLPAHTHVSLGFLLALIDSWDGTELFQVRVGDSLLFSHWFQLATADTSSYLPPPGGLLSSGTELGYSAGPYWSHDRAYDLSLEPAFRDIPHTADSLVVVWDLSAISGPGAAQWQGGTDESWAIDNVSVTLTTPGVDAPPPAVVVGLALHGALPNPSRNGLLQVRLALPTDERATLEAFDVSGRRVAAQDLTAWGAGTHVIALGTGARLPPGLYLLRLRQGRETRTARVVVSD